MGAVSGGHPLQHSQSLQSVHHSQSQRYSMPADMHISGTGGMSHSTSLGHLHGHHHPSHHHVNGMVPQTSGVTKRSTTGSVGSMMQQQHSATLNGPINYAAYGMPHHSSVGPPSASSGQSAQHRREHSVPAVAAPHSHSYSHSTHPQHHLPSSSTSPGVPGQTIASRGPTPHSSGVQHVKVVAPVLTSTTPNASSSASNQAPYHHPLLKTSSTGSLPGPAGHYPPNQPREPQPHLSAAGIIAPPMIRKSSQPLPGQHHGSAPPGAHPSAATLQSSASTRPTEPAAAVTARPPELCTHCPASTHHAPGLSTTQPRLVPRRQCVEWRR